jgi:hypothetical protein
MRSLRKAMASAAVVALIESVAIGRISAQTGTDPAFKTTADMARAIAYTIDVNSPRGAGPMRFESATSHDNVVEVRFTVDDVYFARAKAGADDQRIAMARFYCKEGRLAYLNSGVAIHEIITSTAGSDRFDFTIDKSTCANLASQPQLADSNTIIEMAQTVAQSLNAENDKSTPKAKSLFQFDTATARNGVVDVHYVVANASAARSLNADRTHLIGFMQGYFCGKYGEDVRRGLSLHQIFTLGNNAPVLDFTLDRSSC